MVRRGRKCRLHAGLAIAVANMTLACAHALASGGTMVSLIQSRQTCDTSRYWRCASLSASSDRVEIEISVERNRDSGRMLPVARFQEGLFNERRDFGLAHLNSDA